MLLKVIFVLMLTAAQIVAYRQHRSRDSLLLASAVTANRAKIIRGTGRLLRTALSAVRQCGVWLLLCDTLLDVVPVWLALWDRCTATPHLISPCTFILSSLQQRYSVRLINAKKGMDETVRVGADQVILEAAEAAGVSIPYSCRAASCSSCVGMLVSGSVDQSNQIFLTDEQVRCGLSTVSATIMRSRDL